MLIFIERLLFRPPVLLSGLVALTAAGCSGSIDDDLLTNLDIPVIHDDLASTDTGNDSGMQFFDIRPADTAEPPGQDAAPEPQAPAFEILLRSRPNAYSESLSVYVFGGRLTISSLPGCTVEIDEAATESLRQQADKVEWDSYDVNPTCISQIHRQFDVTVRYRTKIQYLPGSIPPVSKDVTYLAVQDFSYCDGRGSQLPEALFNLLDKIEDLGTAGCEGFPQLVRSEEEQYATERESFRMTVELDGGGVPSPLRTIWIESGFINIAGVGQAPIALSDYDFQQIQAAGADIVNNEPQLLEWCPPYVPRVNIDVENRTSSGQDGSMGTFNYCMADMQSRVPLSLHSLGRRLETLIFNATYRRIRVAPFYTVGLAEDGTGNVYSTGDVDVAVYYEEPLSGFSHNTGYFGGVYWFDSECRSKLIHEDTLASLTSRAAALLEYSKTHEIVACDSDAAQFTIWARVGSDYVNRRFCQDCAIAECDDISVVLPLVDDLKTMRRWGCVM